MTKKRSYSVFILLVLVLVSLTMHFSDFFEAYPWMGKYHVSDPDSLLFLRYYEQSLLQGEIIKEDHYGCFPSVQKNEFPPFHLNFLIKFTQLYFFLFPDSDLDTDFVIGWMPPIAGWLCSLMMVFFAWKQTRSPGLTFLTGFFSVPGVIAYMTFSFLRIDYHFLNTFFIQFWLILSWYYCRKPGLGVAALAGFVVTLFMATWSGTPIFFLMVSVYALFLLLCDSEIAEPFLEFSSASMFVGAVLTGLNLLQSGKFSFAINEYGWFHVLTVLAAGAFFHLLFFLKVKKGFTSAKLVSIVAVLILVFASFAFMAFPAQIYDGIGFLTAKDPIMATISELQPVINFSNLIGSPFQFFKGGALFGLGFFVLPLLAFWPPAKIFAGGGRIIRDWFFFFVVLTLFSARYGRWLGSMPGLFSAIAFYILLEFILEKAHCSKRNWIFAGKVALVCVPFLIAGFIFNYPNFILSSKVSDNEVEAFNWIELNTPQTSGYQSPGLPEYGILGFWDEGNRLSYYTRRPVLVNNALWGYKKMARIFSATSEKEAAGYCEKYRARYIYIRYRSLNDVSIDLFNMYKNKPEAKDDVFSFTRNYIAPAEPVSRYANTFHYWLANQAAIKPTGQFIEPASFFRIIYSSKQPNRLEAPEVLLYEFVAGALISGNVDPGSEVAISIECEFDKVRQLYARNAIADDSGKFKIRLPYSSGYKKGRVRTDEFYKVSYVKNGHRQLGKLFISEEQILGAAEIDLIRAAQIVDR